MSRQLEPRRDHRDDVPPAVAMRRIVAITRERVGRGYLLRVDLDCGHSKLRLSGTHQEVGRETACDRCRP